MIDKTKVSNSSICNDNLNKIKSLNKLIMGLIKLQLEKYSLKSINLHRDIVKIKVTVGTIG